MDINAVVIKLEVKYPCSDLIFVVIVYLETSVTESRNIMGNMLVRDVHIYIVFMMVEFVKVACRFFLKIVAYHPSQNLVFFEIINTRYTYIYIDTGIDE